MAIEEQIEYAKNRGFKMFIWTKSNGSNILKADDIVCIKNLQTYFLQHEEIVYHGFLTSLFIGLKMGIK